MSSRANLGKADRELQAIGAILTALNGLEGESIQRVLDYVFGRLSIGQTRVATPMSLPITTSGPAAIEGKHLKEQVSIRDLKDEKHPESSNQMAALVAYYLSEVAPASEIKTSINAADLEKYFKQAGFKLPKKIPQTLINAAAAGYLDAAGNGMYQLNPVGYNLVVHGLPRGHGGSNGARKRPIGKRKPKRT
jgi:hypothetical protein